MEVYERQICIAKEMTQAFYAYKKEFGDTECLLIIDKNKCNAMNDVKAKTESTPENSKCFFCRDKEM